MTQLSRLRAATTAILVAPRSATALCELRAALAAEDDGTVSDEIWDAVALMADGVELVQIGLDRLADIRGRTTGKS